MLVSNDPLPDWAPKSEDIIRVRRLDNGSGSLSVLDEPYDVVVALVHSFLAREGRLRIMGNTPADMKDPMHRGMAAFFVYGPEDFEVVGAWKHGP